MGKLLLVGRLIGTDLRRWPLPAVLFVLVVGVATTALAVGMTLGDTTRADYAATRAATNGPDLMILTVDRLPAERAMLHRIARRHGVTGHVGPYRLLRGATLSAHGHRMTATVEGRSTAPSSVDRPLVTSGHWLRPGGAVVERGFAAALHIRVGDRITLAGRAFPVVGIAVTTATGIYPNAGLDVGPNDYAGLVWLTDADTRPLTRPELRPGYAMGLTLADPNVAAFYESIRPALRSDPDVRVNIRGRRTTEDSSNRVLADSEAVLQIGGWLLAVAGLAGLVSLSTLRSDQQLRRAGRLKAAGATPGLIGAVLLAQYVLLALVAAAVGLLAAWLTVSAAGHPSASLLHAPVSIGTGTVVPVCLLALLVALLTSAGPAIRVARTPTVAALAGRGGRELTHPAGLTGLAGALPVPLMLGLRLAARRLRRAVLTAAGVAAVAAVIAGLLCWHAQPQLASLSWRTQYTYHAIVAITVALVALAGLDAIVIVWSTALDARRSLAVARAFGATPGQVTAGLVLAPLPAAAAGAAMGMPIGLGLYWLVSSAGAQMDATPPAWWLLAAGAALVLGVAVLGVIPARWDARRPVAPILDAETR
jgi:putative ABC transport system permease protein